MIQQQTTLADAMLPMLIAAPGLALWWALSARPSSSKARTWQPEETDPDSHLKVDFIHKVHAQSPCTGDRYLVVGGCGFLGRRLIDILLDRGEKNITALDIAPRPSDLDGRVKFIQGDVTIPSDLEAACEKIDTVFATFAIIRFMDNMEFQYSLSERINVGGTKNLLDACTKCGVKRLIQTSTSNVVAGHGLNSLEMSEASPYVDKRTSPAHYGFTKALAEQLCLAANGNGGLHTVAIRPCSGIFGPKDRFMLEKALKENQYVVFYPNVTLDYVYVDNVVLGHLLAESHLRKGTAGVAGEAFCITNEAPLSHGDFWRRVQHYRPGFRINEAPPLLGWAIAIVVQGIQWVTRGALKGELAMMTPAMLRTTKMEYAFTDAKARKVLGYRPAYTVDQAIQRVIWTNDQEQQKKKRA